MGEVAAGRSSRRRAGMGPSETVEALALHQSRIYGCGCRQAEGCDNGNGGNSFLIAPNLCEIESEVSSSE